MFLASKEYVFRFSAVKRKRSKSPITNSVMSSRSVSSSGEPSEDVGKLSTDTSTSVTVGKAGPATKRARRTTLAGTRQQDNSDSGKLEAGEAQETVSKQSKQEDVPKNCEISINFIDFVKKINP